MKTFISRISAAASAGAIILFFALPASAIPRRACVLDLRREYMEGATEASWRIEHWRNELRSRGIDAEVVPGARLERELPGFDLLILPETRELTAGQTSAVLAFLERGNSLILTGRSGEKTTGRGERPLAEELGLFYRGLQDGDFTAPQIIFNTPSFLTARIPPGQLLFAAEAPGYVYLENPPGEPAGFWYRSGGEEDLARWFDFPAFASSEKRGGRFVWSGPTIDIIGGDIETVSYFAEFLDNTLDWFGGRPTVGKNPWKNFYEKAVIFAQDTESGFANTLALFEIENLPPTTFFILTDLAKINMNVLRRMFRAPQAEVAVHGDNHDVFRGQSREKQRKRLRGITEFFREAGEKQPKGFRPPEEQYDFYTLTVLAEEGFEYIFADDWPASAAPGILRFGDESIVQFPLLNKDDIKIIVEQRLYDNERILEEYIRDIDSIFALGGLYMFDFHSHVLASDRHIEVIQGIIDYLEPLNAWKTSCGRAASWWKAREGVDFEITERGRGFIEITAVNRGKVPAGNVSFTVWFPEAVRSARAVTAPGGKSPAGFMFLQNRAAAVMPELDPLEEFRFRVLWEN